MTARTVTKTPRRIRKWTAQELADLVEDAHWMATHGEHPDAAAARLGFSSGDTLIKKLGSLRRLDIAHLLQANRNRPLPGGRR